MEALGLTPALPLIAFWTASSPKHRIARPPQTPLPLCGTILTQLTCHALRMAEFEAELPGEGGSHGGHMVSTWLTMCFLACRSRTAVP
jgi:hypothetical protein